MTVPFPLIQLIRMLRTMRAMHMLRLTRCQGFSVLPLLGLALGGLLLLANPALARRGEAPVGRPALGGAAASAVARVPALSLPPVSRRQRLAEDDALVGTGPLRFAEPHDLSVTPLDAGTWVAVTDGVVWQLQVEAEGATDLGIGFGRFELPEGATLHVWSVDSDYYEGPYTAADNETHGELWVPPVVGSRAVIELFVPNSLDDPLAGVALELVRVGAGYRDILGASGILARQGSCNNDVICAVGDPWQDQIRSVAAYSTGASRFCTGTLLADTSRSFRNFFLTAAHCKISALRAPSVVVFWNYQSPVCGVLAGGSLSQNQTGSYYRAGRTDVDFNLLELDDEPRPEFNVFYSGWDRSGVAPSAAVGIHHPRGDEKAISFDDDPLTTSDNCIGTGGSQTHWRVDSWDDGTTEPGSSGSGIWDANTKRLVGQLSGGLASCLNPGGHDCYGKFSLAWDGSSPQTRLRDWLDPIGTGQMFVDGADQQAALRLLAAEVVDSCASGFGDANQVVEPGESLALEFELEATGSFTSITGTLSSESPDLLITVAEATWPDLDDGTSAVSLFPFEIVLSEISTCYESLDFVLTVSSAETPPALFAFSTEVGRDLVAGLPLGIPDGDGGPSVLESTLESVDGGMVGTLGVRMVIDHSYVGDLSITLTSPSGTEVVLLDRPGVPADEFGCADADLDVVFEDAAVLANEDHCAQQTPWASGPILPSEPLSVFSSEPLTGLWTLRVTDWATADLGTLVDWGLVVDPALAGRCETCLPLDCPQLPELCDPFAYKLYRVGRARGQARYAGSDHALVDEIESRRVSLRRRAELGLAVSVDGEALELEQAAVLCYKAVDDFDEPAEPWLAPFSVEVSSHVATQQLDVKKPRMLCRSAAVSNTEPTELGEAPDLGSFTCYKARRSPEQPKLVTADLQLSDAIESKLTRVLRASALCVPTAVDGVEPPEGDRALVCYDIKDQADQPRLERSDVFVGSSLENPELALQRSARLCVPAEFSVVPENR